MDIIIAVVVIIVFVVSELNMHFNVILNCLATKHCQYIWNFGNLSSVSISIRICLLSVTWYINSSQLF